MDKRLPKPSGKEFLRIVLLLSVFLLADIFSHQAESLNALNFLPASRLLKLETDPTVYYVNQNGLKMPIPSAQVFLSYGAKWEDIEIVGAAELDFYRDAEYIKLTGDARVYQLKSGVKRYLTQKAASALKIFPEEVIPVNKTEFNAYTRGSTLDETEAIALRAEKDALALLKQEEQKQCVPNEEVGGEDGCKVFQAMEAKDPALCEEIASEEWKAKCFVSVIPESGDFLANCRTLSNGSFKDQCVSQIALAKSDPALCAEITDSAKKQFCESSLGIASKDINACDNLLATDAETGKNICLYTYALANSDSRACEKIPAGSAYKTSCDNFLNQQLSMQKKSKPKWFASTAERFVALIAGKPAQAQVPNFIDTPVGGKFLPGLFDIYTPTLVPPCLLVSVAGPNPGVFNFMPIRVYDYFLITPWHVGLDTLGLATGFPTVCPPNYFMFGSSGFLF